MDLMLIRNVFSSRRMFYELAKKWRSAYEHDIYIYTYISIYIFMVEFFIRK